MRYYGKILDPKDLVTLEKAQQEAASAASDKITNPSTKSANQILGYDGTDWVAIDKPTSGVWGQITGTLSAQTDLNTALTGETSAREQADTAEATARAEADSALDTRIQALEARGRFLANWNASTGEPTTYPTIPSGSSYPYTYSYKSGDYYIVGTVPESGTVYMPDGTGITKQTAESSWTVGKTATTDTVSIGDQFVYDSARWTHIATAKDVAWGNITGSIEDQTDLQTTLATKADLASPALTGTPTAPNPDITTSTQQIATTKWVSDKFANYSPEYEPGTGGEAGTLVFGINQVSEGTLII